MMLCNQRVAHWTTSRIHTPWVDFCATYNLGYETNNKPCLFQGTQFGESLFVEFLPIWAKNDKSPPFPFNG